MVPRVLRLVSLGLVAALLLGTTAEANLLTTYPCVNDQAECNQICHLFNKECQPCPRAIGRGWICYTKPTSSDLVEAAPSPPGVSCMSRSFCQQCPSGTRCALCPDPKYPTLAYCQNVSASVPSSVVLNSAPVARQDTFCFDRSQCRTCPRKTVCGPCPERDHPTLYACWAQPPLGPSSAMPLVLTQGLAAP
eukprot:RCo006287